MKKLLLLIMTSVFGYVFYSKYRAISDHPYSSEMYE